MSLKLSIIVAAYNIEENIISCLKSLHNQKSDEAEFLIINDGSTDNTLEKIYQYINKVNDKRFKIYSNQNMGLSNTRNYGLKHSKGKYIWFVDGDDYLIDNNAIDIVIETMDKNKLDVLQFNNKENGKIKYGGGESKGIVNGKDYFCKSLKDRNYYEAVWSFVYSKRLLKINNFYFKDIISEDVLWTPKILFNAKRVYKLDKVLYQYEYRPNSIIHNQKNENKKNHDILNTFIELNEELDVDELSENQKVIVNRYLANNYISFLYKNIINDYFVSKKDVFNFCKNKKISVKYKIKEYVYLLLPNRLLKKFFI